MAASFAQTSAPGGGKREQLTAEQKTEIRDRVERLKAERAKADAAKAAPAPKAEAPKKTSKVIKKTKHVAKADSGKTAKTNNAAKKAKAKT